MNPRNCSHASVFLCALLALTSGCGAGSSGGSEAFNIRTASYASAASTPPVVFGGWLIYFADEATSGATDLNGDGPPFIDAVAVAVNLSNGSETLLGVAAQAAAAIGNELYLVVSETEDGVDWNSGMSDDSGPDDLVLLHWSSAAGLPAVLVATLDESNLRPLAVANGRLYFTQKSASGPDDSTLAFVALAAPLVVVPVQNAEAGQLHPHILGTADGLLFATLNEAVEGIDLNGDLVLNDAAVLALLNTGGASNALERVGLALADDDAAFAAVSTGTDDWLVAFLVSEDGQGVDLDNPASFSASWKPENCPLLAADGLNGDQVLHYLHYASWSAAASLPINTGLAGQTVPTGLERVLALDGFVATLSREDQVGCDLNDDGDEDDSMARWVAALPAPAPVLPPGLIAHMIAVEDVPGGSEGLAAQGDRLVIVASESKSDSNFDGDPADHDLVAWLDPALGAATTWHFQHPGQSILLNVNDPPVAEPFTGASWMAAAEQGERLGVGFQESVVADVLDLPNLSINNNNNCNFLAKDSDSTDSLPTWARITGSGASASMTFPGMGYAVTTNNPGLVISQGFAFFRVSENNDNLSFNGGEGDKLDNILFRNPVSSCAPVAMATASSIVGPVVYTDGISGAAFLASESEAGVQLNTGDSDMSDLVVRYFSF